MQRPLSFPWKKGKGSHSECTLRAPLVLHAPAPVSLIVSLFSFSLRHQAIIREIVKVNIDDVWIFPANGGKFCNPLDNTLWHEPRDEKATAKALKTAFISTPRKDLHS